METTILTAKYEREMIEIRHHLHANPELGFKEYETTKLIKEKLTEYGVEIADVGMETGCVGVIRGAKPGKVLGIRADIDALPILEETGLPFKSLNDGVMHACGHDMHCTILLYVARVLAQLKEELCGTVLLLFQPAEEVLDGALRMVEHVFTDVAKPDSYAALHVSPSYPAGEVGFKSGAVNASSDWLFITVEGRGGHGAHPESFVDPVTISAYLITQLQTVVARENHPLNPVVLTIGSIHGGTAGNIVPDRVEMVGTLRTLKEESRKAAKEAIARMVELCCTSMRGKGTVTFSSGIPVLNNDADVIENMKAAATEVLGEEKVHTFEQPSMGSEDFAVILEDPRSKAPGAIFRLGITNEDENSRRPLHNCRNIFDDRAIKTGADVLVQYARNYLKD